MSLLFASIVLKPFDFTSQLDLVDHRQCSTPLIEPQKLDFTGPSRLPRPFVSDLSHSRQLRVCCSPWPHRCLGRHPSLITLLTTFGSSPPSILRQLVDLTSNCLSPFHWFVVNMPSLKLQELAAYSLRWSRHGHHLFMIIGSVGALFHINLIVRSFLIVPPFLLTLPHCLRAFFESVADLLTKPLFVLLSLLVLLFPVDHAGRVIAYSIIVILSPSISTFPQLPLIPPNRSRFDSTSSPTYTSCSLP